MIGPLGNTASFAQFWKYGSKRPGIYFATYFRFLIHHVKREPIDEINDEPLKFEIWGHTGLNYGIQGHVGRTKR